MDEDVQIFESNTPLSKVDAVDHPPLEGIFSIRHDLEAMTDTRKRFHFKNANYKGMNDYLRSFDWISALNLSDSLDSLDPNILFSKFYQILNTTFTKFVPFRKPYRFSRPIWYTRDLVTLKNRKTLIYKRFKRTGRTNDYILYNILRKRFNSFHSYLYREYISSVESNIKTDPYSFWKFVKSKRKNSSIPSIMRHDEVTGTGAAKICDMFADFFESVYRNEENIPIIVNDNINRIDSIILDSMDIQIAVNRLKRKYHPGSDGVPSSVLISCVDGLIGPLLMLFNLSISKGLYPDVLKTTYVTPIHKAGSRTDINNYRGVAEMCAIGKVFDSAVNERFSEFFEEFESEFQHGFVKKKSTTTNLIEFTSTAINLIESRNQLDVIYFDFARAFDRVQPNILLSKLSEIGVNGMLYKWFESYLSNRFQRILISGHLSRLINVYSGVGQGSHFGPTLYRVMVHRMPLIFQNVFKLLFADDLKIFYPIRCMADCIVLQGEINRLMAWCAANHLDLNVGKCSVVSYYRKHEPIFHDYYIGDFIVIRGTEKKDLGVTFDTKLTFVAHIGNIVNKACSMLGFLKRFSRDFHDPYTIKVLFCALVRSGLEYCSVVWNPQYKIHSMRIESVQKRFLLFALRSLRWGGFLNLPHYEDRLKLIDMDTLENRRKSFDLLFLSDIIHMRVRSTFVSDRVNTAFKGHNLRGPLSLSVGSHRTNYGYHEPVNRMCRLHNECSCVSLDISRVQLRKLLSSHTCLIDFKWNVDT